MYEIVDFQLRFELGINLGQYFDGLCLSALLLWPIFPDDFC